LTKIESACPVDGPTYHYIKVKDPGIEPYMILGASFEQN